MTFNELRIDMMASTSSVPVLRIRRVPRSAARSLPFLSLAILLSFLPARTQTWTQTNGPFGAISVLASGGPTLYAGEEGGTVFVLDDDENGWTRHKVADNTGGITALVAFGDSVYAGTGSGSLYFSADRAATWKKLNDDEARISTILVKGEMIFLAHDHDNSFNDGTVRRSVDGGAAWTKLTTGLPGRNILKIVEHAGVLLGLTEKEGTPIYRSTDNGETWAAAPAVNEQITTLFVADGNLYASARTVLLRSTDGAAWTRIAEDANGIVTAVALSGDTLITANTWLWLNGYLYSSVDGGENVLKSYPAGETCGLVTLVRHKGLLYVGSYRGVYRASLATAAAGEKWEPVNRGLTNVYVTGMAFTGSTLLVTSDAGSMDANGGGVFQTKDLGGTWIENNKGLTGWNYRTIGMGGSGGIVGGDSGVATMYASAWATRRLNLPQPSISGVFVTRKGYYLAVSARGFWRADRNLTSWILPRNGLPVKSTFFRFAGRDSIVYLSTTNGIYTSIDDGENWAYLADFDNNVATAIIGDERDMYAGSSAGVHHSTDDGVTWKLGAEGLSERGKYVNALVMQGSTVYAGTDDGIFRSTDKGATWNRTDSLLKGMKVTSFAVGPNHLFAGTYGFGVYRTGDVLSAPEPAEAPDGMLRGNRPNPWSGSTVVEFILPEQAHVLLTLTDPLGVPIRTLLDAERGAGEYRVTVTDDGLAPGVYFYTLRAGSRVETGKMIVE